MRVSLPFRESFQSGPAFVIMVAMVLAPLFISLTMGVMPAEVLPSGTSVNRYVNVTAVTVPGVKLGSGHTFSCAKLNVTAVRLGLISYYSYVCGVEFILAGVLSSFVVGQALEYKYFFLEVLLTKSRLRAFMSRYGASLLSVMFASLPASLIASITPYMLSAYGSLSECFLVCLGLVLLACLSGASFGTLASLGLRSVSGGIIATLGFAGLLAMLSASKSPLKGFIVPLFAAGYGYQGIVAYVSLFTLINVLSLWRVIKVEY